MILQPDSAAVDHLIRTALAEDIGAGDVTTRLIPPKTEATMYLTARQPLVACGAGLMHRVFDAVGSDVEYEDAAADGARLDEGEALLTVSGRANILLTAERTALNILQRLCGVATLTAQYVDALAGTECTLLDTRKTMPGWRELDKYAVRCGGGTNHRMRLDDAYMIKDNHIAVSGGIEKAVARARDGANLPVIVECDTLEQVREALAAQPDRLLLDNMDADQLREAVKLVDGAVPLEASGGVRLENIREIAEAGVNFISVGAITHSAVALDIGADIEISRFVE